MNNPFFDTQTILNQAQEFKKNFNGNAQEKVEQLLKTGQMSQAEFDRLMPIAQRLANMLPK